MAAKIEIAMKKSEAMSWARLDLPAPAPAAKENEPAQEDEDEDEEDWWPDFKRHINIFSYSIWKQSSVPFLTLSRVCKLQDISDLCNFISQLIIPPLFVPVVIVAFSIED